MSLTTKLGIAGLGLASIVGLQGCDKPSAASSTINPYKQVTIQSYDVGDFKGVIDGAEITLSYHEADNFTPEYVLKVIKRDGSTLEFHDYLGNGLRNRHNDTDNRDLNDSERVIIQRNGQTASYVVLKADLPTFNSFLSQFESYLKKIQNERKKLIQKTINQ